MLDYLYSISLAQPLSTRNTLSPYSNAELAHADNSFTTFLNRPSILLTGGLTPLVGRRQKEKKGVAYSEGEGIARNKDFLQRGLGRLIASLVFPPSALAPATSYDSTSQDTPSLIELPEPQPVDTYKFKATPEPPLEKHPWAHHTRAICASDTCTFITNVPLLPPPDTVPYPVRTHLNLSVSAIDEPVLRPPTLDEWENHLGITGRGGWTEGGLDGRELFGEGERWALRYGYENAVDGDWTTAFRSANTVEKDDYVGLALVRGLDQIWTPKVTLHFLLGGIEAIAPGLLIEVSVDGYTWVSPLPSIRSHLTGLATAFDAGRQAPTARLHPLQISLVPALPRPIHEISLSSLASHLPLHPRIKQPHFAPRTNRSTRLLDPTIRLGLSNRGKTNGLRGRYLFGGVPLLATTTRRRGGGEERMEIREIEERVGREKCGLDGLGTLVEVELVSHRIAFHYLPCSLQVSAAASISLPVSRCSIHLAESISRWISIPRQVSISGQVSRGVSQSRKS